MQYVLYSLFFNITELISDNVLCLTAKKKKSSQSVKKRKKREDPRVIITAMISTTVINIKFCFKV